jgi:hypothetical protein
VERRRPVELVDVHAEDRFDAVAEARGDLDRVPAVRDEAAGVRVPEVVHDRLGVVEPGALQRVCPGPLDGFECQPVEHALAAG